MRNKFVHTVITFSFFFGSSFYITAQSPPCGMSAADNQLVEQQLIMNRAAAAQNPSLQREKTAVTYIPTKFHLVGLNDGSGRVLESNVLNMLCELNAYFQDQSIQFYLAGNTFSYFNSTNVYNAPKLSGSTATMRSKKVEGALNVYITGSGDDGSSSNSGGTTLGYYDPNTGNDFLVIIKSEANAIKSATVTHEAGHYLSLLHTFSGFDATPYQENGCASTVATDGRTITEFVTRGTGANCATAGDRMCDTPADYNLGFGANSCTYSGSTKDPNCVALNPDELNMMGYFINCPTGFSTEQKNAMRNSINNDNRRTFIKNNTTVPNQNDVSATGITLGTPTQAGITPFGNSVTFDWSDAPNAVGYVVEVSRFPTFAEASIRSFFAAQSQITVDNKTYPNTFANNTTYYWRVRPIGQYKNCTAATTERRSFITGTATPTNEVNPLEYSFSIAPNPVSSNFNYITFKVSSIKGYEADVKLMDLNGRVLLSQMYDISTGDNEQVLPLANGMANGIYVLSVNTPQGLMNKKVVIAR